MTWIRGDRTVKGAAEHQTAVWSGQFLRYRLAVEIQTDALEVEPQELRVAVGMKVMAAAVEKAAGLQTGRRQEFPPLPHVPEEAELGAALRRQPWGEGCE